MNVPCLTLLWSLTVVASAIASQAESTPSRPNIVLIITDDMGFSDIGCYGGEIETPNIDRLAAEGLKFSQFYNCGKCEPSRAALTSGHQWFSRHSDVALRKDSPSIGEVMQSAGYRTMMVGKWHCYGSPFTRGFHRHYGFMGGGTNFFLGDNSFTLDGKPWPVPKKDFYVSTALSEYAVSFIHEEVRAHPDKPFFLYLAYNAPHSPIQAPATEVAKYRGKYRKGWDVIRQERFARQKALGLAGPHWRFPERPSGIPAWDTLDATSQDFEDLRMATYAAMVDCVDQSVGDVIETLDTLKIRENTLFIFMNDNGASPNDRVRGGEFGSANGRWNLGLGWAHATNTPLKYYKRTQHSGGVTTPCVVQWPRGIKPLSTFVDTPLHVIDIIPTFVELAGGQYPANFGGKQHPPLPGRSFAGLLEDPEQAWSERSLYFALFNNLAIVDHGWRLVTAYSEPWQLYNLNEDRCETRDLADSHPERLQEMLALQTAFYARENVSLRLKSGEVEPAYSPTHDGAGTPIRPSHREGTRDPDYALALIKARATGKQLTESEMATLKE